MRSILIVLCATTLLAACGSGDASTTGSSQPQPTKIDLPPITLTKATEVLTAAEVAAVFPGATFKITEERNDPPAGYSAISGCRFVEQEGEELRRRNVVITVRSHGVEADAASFLKNNLELAQEAGGKVTPVPELGEHAFLVIRAASSGGSSIKFRRGKDWFEVNYVAFRGHQDAEVEALLRGLAQAVLAPR
ncbi:MAG: hypothetical protein MUC36_18260 [Planctomycetes bacterium]|jgi:hypothetical protein|nr:hypothetical protein [Planctomycetota bacterium]